MDKMKNPGTSPGSSKAIYVEKLQAAISTIISSGNFSQSKFSLETNTHIAHLSYTYLLPDGINEDILWNGIKSKDDIHFIKSIYDAVVVLNPDLQ